ILHAAEVAAAYSTSEDDKATLTCFFELQVTTPNSSVNTFAETLCLSSNELAQSLSVNPHSLKLENLEYKMPYYIAPTV
ncbi:hypothetical protein Csa_023516, partial [Cucumis sativus]